MVDSRISKFVEVFDGYVNQVSRVDFGPEGGRYRKVLYFTIIEALAKVRYPARGAARAFSSFVVQFCGWSDGDRVSLPHLVAALRRTSDSSFNPLRDWAYPELDAWGSGGPVWIDRDPEKSAIQRLWPKDASGASVCMSELGLSLRGLQHRNLLYGYRSKLSHESREPTFSFEDGHETQAYYNSLFSSSGSPTEWHLVYPSAFLEASCRQGISALQAWLSRERTDPYSQFNFGPYLIEALNCSGEEEIAVCE